MKKKTWKIIVRHLVLALLAIIWLIPIVWLVVTSLSTTKGVSYQHFFPEHWTLANYHQLFSSFKSHTTECIRNHQYKAGRDNAGK